MLAVELHTLRRSTQKWNRVNDGFPPSSFYVKPDRHLGGQRQGFMPVSILTVSCQSLALLTAL